MKENHRISQAIRHHEQAEDEVWQAIRAAQLARAATTEQDRLMFEGSAVRHWMAARQHELFATVYQENA
jgi:hypothetical protein